MEKWKKIRMLERLAIIAGVGLITAGGLWGLSKIEPDKKYLRGKDFENVEWVSVYNNSENVKRYYEMENIPHNGNNSVLYERVIRDYNGNPKSLKGFIEVACLDKRHGYNFVEIREGMLHLSGIPTPRDTDVNSK